MRNRLMKQVLSLAMVAGAVAISVGCANGPCRQMKKPELAGGAASTATGTATPAPTPAAGVAGVTGSGGTVATPKGGAMSSDIKPTAREASVLVYKPDGSLQCGMGKAISLEEMEKQLSGIRVSSRDKRPDGLMHIQVCGSPTGMINVYEIPASSLKEAEARGFKKFER